MGRPQVHIRLSEQQKARWQGYVDDSPEYDTLTELIRRSVERTIAVEGDSDDATPRVQGDNEPPSEQLDILDERTSRILTRLDSIEDTVSDAANAMYESQTAGRFVNLELYEYIPTDRDNSATIEDIFRKQRDELGMTKEKVEDSLGVLAQMVDTVSSHREGGSICYYKED